jgi:Zn-dependent metalloprotease
LKHLAALTCLAVVAAGAATGLSGTAAVASSGGPRDNAVLHARAGIRTHPDAVAASRDDAYSVRDVVLDDDGSEHVRFDRSYKGLPVLGGDFVVHDDSRGELTSVSRTQRAAISLSTTPGVSSSEAAGTAAAEFEGRADSESSPALLVDARHGAPALAWGVIVSGVTAAGDPSELHVVVDASTGAVRDAYDGIEATRPAPSGTTAPADGLSLYDGKVALTTVLSKGSYSLQDPTRGGQSTYDLGGRTSGSGTLVTSTTGTFGNGSTSDRKTVAVDAQYGAAQTWDYYRSTFGRNGIANDGKGAPSRVHYSTGYSNAFWSDSCFCMTYGDGNGTTTTPLVSLDVAGHEMTHGVTSRTAGLTYSGESGGLNEATSDIFGTMVEFAAGNVSDAGDYLIGERIHPNGYPIRYMDDPAKDGKSASCWSSTVGSLDVHYSSGVANHFFYLLAVGSGLSGYGNSPTCDGSVVVGIGNDRAARIWYRALTTYMTSSTDFAGARSATLRAATDLYGEGGSDYSAVASAWSAVGVR